MENSTTLFSSFFDTFTQLGRGSSVNSKQMTLYCRTTKQPSYDIYFTKSFTNESGFKPGELIHIGLNLNERIIGISKNLFPSCVSSKVNQNGSPRFGNKDIVLKMIDSFDLKFNSDGKLIKKFKLVKHPSIFSGISLFKIED